MPETLLSIVTDYSIERTGHSRDRMESWFAERSDNYLDYILRSVLPPEYCYDGIKYNFSRVESAESIDLVCVIWYLQDGHSLNTALRFSAKVEGHDVRFRYSLVPATDFPLHKELLAEPDRLMEIIQQSYRWTPWNSGVLSAQ